MTIFLRRSRLLHIFSLAYYLKSPFSGQIFEKMDLGCCLFGQKIGILRAEKPKFENGLRRNRMCSSCQALPSQAQK